ncbi:MAG: hypothetical protein L0Y55_21280 [Anaerolineales bacterium]|nr:hypothetical protein [Anaerolineales bacterium]
MKNNLLFGTLFLLALALAIAFGASNALAQGPGNTGPGSAVYLDNQAHFVPPNTTLWYKFDYDAQRLPVELILFSGLPQQMQFNVYTPDQIGSDFSVGNPIGRGAAPSGSDNLVWKGVFYGAGTYYVELINPSSISRTFMLGIAGGGVTLRIQPPAPTPLPTRIPPPPPQPTINALQSLVFPAIATLRAPVVTTTVTATIASGAMASPTVSPTPQSIVIVVVPATPTPTLVVPTATFTPVRPPIVNDWWTNAFYVVNGWTYTIPGNAERWFVFDYAGDRSKIEIRIPGGNERRLPFRLFTLDQVSRYMVDGTPIGVGTAPIVPCDAGRCVSNDLVWAGDFSAGGTYFIQVTNFDPTPKNYQFNITGGGVTLGR